MPDSERETGDEGELVRSLFGSDVCAELGPPVGSLADLHPAERVAVERAVPKRVREFAAGRILARRALDRLGLRGASIPRGEDRAPVWPAGTVGSISHTADLCLTAVAERRRYASLGVDVEVRKPLREELWRLVLTDAEKDWVRRSPGDRELLALLVFSAKECAYKCQYPLTRRVFGFQEARVAFTDDLCRFRASFSCAGLSNGPLEVEGRVARSAGHVFTASTIRA